MLTDARREHFACNEDCSFVGTTAAILIGAGIAAAGGLGAAAIQSKQVGKAVEAQKEATNQAIQQLQPFQQVGTKAFTTLGELMGLGPSGGATTGPPQALRPMDAPISPGQANFAGYTPGGGYLGKNVPMSERMSNPHASTSSGYTAQQHGASPAAAMPPMLRVQAPNGQIYQVPADKAGEAQQNGGVVLGTV